MRMLPACLLALWSLYASYGAAQAAEGNGWRGPRGDGKARDFLAPKTWPDKLTKIWNFEVGLGHSAPVTVGDRIFQFSRLNDQETLACLDMSGSLVWRKRYAAPYKMNSAARGHGKGPKSSPYVVGDRVITLGISGILSCWSASDGARLWQHEFDGKYQATAPLYGTGMSPLVVGGSVYAHVGGHDGGAFCSFAINSGMLQWSHHGEGPAYTSPIVATLAGTKHLVTQSQSQCFGISLDGELLWEIPYETEYVQNIVTPVVAHERAIFSGYNRGVTAYRFKRATGRFQHDEAWHNREVSMYMSSPVLTGGRLYGFSQRNSGQLFALDPTSGETIWTGPGRQGDNASLLLAGNVLFALTTEGELIACDRSSDEYKELVRYKVADTETWAHLAAVGKRFLVKDVDTLSVWALE